MFQRLDHRGGHYLLLLAAAAALFLPNLGGPSLWDGDEGNNATCGKEMLEADNWRVPTFNYKLRVDKPALLYWLQILAYQCFGVGEFAARLPSALAGLLTVFLTYELGRLMFGSAVGLLAGLVLASAVLFCAAAHFANPDALLAAGTLLTFFCFWKGFVAGRMRFVLVGASMGCAVLAKGPVGLVLPLAVICLFLLCERQLRLLLDWRLALGVVSFVVVALPWYIWVGVETRFVFIREFIEKHNVSRFLSPMENHSGPIYYYLLALAVGFAPWSVFLIPALWSSIRAWRKREETPVHESDDSPPQNFRSLGKLRKFRIEAHVFLCCWAALYVVFFSVSRTKLPNYILPIYPALAIVTAHYLLGWQRGLIQPPGWVMHLSLAGLALVGIVTAVGLAVAGGGIEVPILRGQRLPGLEAGWLLGFVPLVGSAVAFWCVRRQLRVATIVCVAVVSLVFVGVLAAWGGSAVEAHKAPRPLAQAILADQSEREIRIGALGYNQPSLVFYCGREVLVLQQEAQALDFLRYPIPVYLVAPAPVWERLAARVRGPYRLLSRQRDLYRGCDILVVTNR